MAASNSTLNMTLASDTEIVFTRVFSVPRKLLFEAMTKPEHIRNWWGPRDQTLPVCEMDVRPGGSYRFVSRKAGRADVPFKGVFREISPYDKLVFTQILDIPPFDQSEIVVTALLTEKDGKTTLHETMTFPSKADRDGTIKNGMERGAVESLERLEELLARLA